jgi:hypothetical protein
MKHHDGDIDHFLTARLIKQRIIQKPAWVPGHISYKRHSSAQLLSIFSTVPEDQRVIPAGRRNPGEYFL